MPLESIAETVADQIRRQEFVEVYAHHDADGIAAGSILCHAMERAGIRFSLRIRHEVNPAELKGDARPPALRSRGGNTRPPGRDDGGRSPSPEV